VGEYFECTRFARFRTACFFAPAALRENSESGLTLFFPRHSIGSAVARALHAHGCALALTYRSGSERIVALAQSLSTEASAAPVSTHKADMASEAELTALLPEVAAAHGGKYPDILIVNAGYGKRISSLTDIPPAEFDTMVSVNLRAAFLLSQLCVPHMQTAGWGRVVYVTSIAAHGGGINGCHYAASKAGVQGMMRNLAMKHAREGITFNDVAPAMIGETGMIPTEDTVKGTAGDPKHIPVGRLGTPEEVANVVEMCCRTGYLTGQTIVLSGGLK
jgi:3-oxoacyl-[acyl-carrier protein] reductase